MPKNTTDVVLSFFPINQQKADERGDIVAGKKVFQSRMTIQPYENDIRKKPNKLSGEPHYHLRQTARYLSFFLNQYIFNNSSNEISSPIF